MPQLSVYRGPAPGGPVNNNNYATWLNQPDLWALEFMADGDWYQIEGPTWILNPWRDWVAAKPGRRLILSVPMLPWTPAEASLQTGATGAYNAHFSTLANNLISRGMGNTIIRPGWEFNGGWYKWAAAGKQTHFINYWRHIVNSMRYLSDGVTPRPGANFQFCWNPNHGYNQFPAEQAYPGDAYVDFVGSDVYDQSWMQVNGVYQYPIPAGATQADIDARRQRVWTDDILNGPRGLVYWRNFSASHGKGFVLPEWGCMRRTDGHGGGDNPAFITNMYNYMTTHPVSWASYFDADNGVAASKLSPTTSLPNASARFLQLFSGTSGPLLEETFEDSAANGWTASPAARWSIVTDSGDKAYKYDFDWNNQTGLSTAGSASWTNYTLTVDFKITDFQSWSETRFFFRYVNSSNYYCLEARENGGSRRLVLVKVVNGVATDLATYYTALNINTWYVVGITANGSALSVTFNGASALSVTDASHGAGAVGLGAWKQDVFFDNVTVD